MKRLFCPRCAGFLTSDARSPMRGLYCALGHGRFLPLGFFRKLTHPRFAEKIWESSLQPPPSPGTAQKSCICPKCNLAMRVLSVSMAPATIEIDLCRECQGLWLDYGELDEFQRIHDQARPEKERPAVAPEVANEIAKLLLEAEKNRRLWKNVGRVADVLNTRVRWYRRFWWTDLFWRRRLPWWMRWF